MIRRVGCTRRCSEESTVRQHGGTGLALCWTGIIHEPALRLHRAMSGLSVFDVEAGEEIFELRDLPIGCGVVLLDGRQFHGASDLTDSIESVPSAVAFHSMSQHLDSRKVRAIQGVTKPVKVFSAVG